MIVGEPLRLEQSTNNSETQGPTQSIITLPASVQRGSRSTPNAARGSNKQPIERTSSLLRDGTPSKRSKSTKSADSIPWIHRDVVFPPRDEYHPTEKYVLQLVEAYPSHKGGEFIKYWGGNYISHSYEVPHMKQAIIQLSPLIGKYQEMISLLDVGNVVANKDKDPNYTIGMHEEKLRTTILNLIKENDLSAKSTPNLPSPDPFLMSHEKINDATKGVIEPLYKALRDYAQLGSGVCRIYGKRTALAQARKKYYSATHPPQPDKETEQSPTKPDESAALALYPLTMSPHGISATTAALANYAAGIGTNFLSEGDVQTLDTAISKVHPTQRPISKDAGSKKSSPENLQNADKSLQNTKPPTRAQLQKQASDRLARGMTAKNPSDLSIRSRDGYRDADTPISRALSSQLTPSGQLSRSIRDSSLHPVSPESSSSALDLGVITATSNIPPRTNGETAPEDRLRDPPNSRAPATGRKVGREPLTKVANSQILHQPSPSSEQLPGQGSGILSLLYNQRANQGASPLNDQPEHSSGNSALDASTPTTSNIFTPIPGTSTTGLQQSTEVISIPSTTTPYSISDSAGSGDPSPSGPPAQNTNQPVDIRGKIFPFSHALEERASGTAVRLVRMLQQLEPQLSENQLTGSQVRDLENLIGEFSSANRQYLNRQVEESLLYFQEGLFTNMRNNFNNFATQEQNARLSLEGDIRALSGVIDTILENVAQGVNNPELYGNLRNIIEEIVPDTVQRELVNVQTAEGGILRDDCCERLTGEVDALRGQVTDLYNHFSGLSDVVKVNKSQICALEDVQKGQMRYARQMLEEARDTAQGRGGPTVSERFDVVNKDTQHLREVAAGFSHQLADVQNRLNALENFHILDQQQAQAMQQAHVAQPATEPQPNPPTQPATTGIDPSILTEFSIIPPEVAQAPTRAGLYHVLQKGICLLEQVHDAANRSVFLELFTNAFRELLHGDIRLIFEADQAARQVQEQTLVSQLKAQNDEFLSNLSLRHEAYMHELRAASQDSHLTRRLAFEADQGKLNRGFELEMDSLRRQHSASQAQLGREHAMDITQANNKNRVDVAAQYGENVRRNIETRGQEQRTTADHMLKIDTALEEIRHQNNIQMDMLHQEMRKSNEVLGASLRMMVEENKQRLEHTLRSQGIDEGLDRLRAFHINNDFTAFLMDELIDSGNIAPDDPLVTMFKQYQNDLHVAAGRINNNRTVNDLLQQIMNTTRLTNAIRNHFGSRNANEAISHRMDRMENEFRTLATIMVQRTAHNMSPHSVTIRRSYRNPTVPQAKRAQTYSQRLKKAASTRPFRRASTARARKRRVKR